MMYSNKIEYNTKTAHPKNMETKISYLDKVSRRNHGKSTILKTKNVYDI